jgi:hypothetical protein
MNMKTTNHNSVLIAGLCALALSFGTVAYAEKGAETLIKRTKTPTTATIEAAAPMAHKCVNCTDELVSVVDKGTKGPNHLVTKVFRHNCAVCDTRIVTMGDGKAKKDVAIHSCNAEVKPVCCAKN